MFFCTCPSCDITKNKFLKNNAQTRGFLDVGNSHFISEMLFKDYKKNQSLVNLKRQMLGIRETTRGRNRPRLSA